MLETPSARHIDSKTRYGGEVIVVNSLLHPLLSFTHTIFVSSLNGLHIQMSNGYLKPRPDDTEPFFPFPFHFSE